MGYRWVANIWSYFNPPLLLKVSLEVITSHKGDMPTATSPLGCQKPLPHASSQLTVTCDHSVLWTWKSNFVNLHNFLHSQPGRKSSSVLPADWPTAAAHISRETWRMLLLPLAVEIWSEKVGCLVWGATAATSWSGPSSKSFWNAFTPSLQGWFVRLRQQIWWSGPQIDHRSWS